MKIVFLDIDGVVQRIDAEFVFCSEPKLVAGLKDKFNIDYSVYPTYSVYNCLYDWDEQAIARLKYILDQTVASIVASTEWRSKEQPNKMRDLLTIHGLDKYYLGDNPFVPVKTNFEQDRAWEIRKSLEIYKPDNYLVLDDKKGLMQFFPNNCIITQDLISINDMHEAVRILKRKQKN